MTCTGVLPHNRHHGTCHDDPHIIGAVRAVVPDDLKSAASRASWYEPELNPSYLDWARCYGVAVLPARPYHPSDKAAAEVGVQVVDPARKLTVVSLTNTATEGHTGQFTIDLRNAVYSGSTPTPTR